MQPTKQQLVDKLNQAKIDTTTARKCARKFTLASLFQAGYLWVLAINNTDAQSNAIITGGALLIIPLFLIFLFAQRNAIRSEADFRNTYKTLDRPS